MGYLIFFACVIAIFVVFARRGALAGCFSIPLALIAGTWMGVNVWVNATFSWWIVPLLMTAGLAAMVFLPTENDAIRRAAKSDLQKQGGQGPTWLEKPISPILDDVKTSTVRPSYEYESSPISAPAESQVAASYIVEVDRSDYLPATTDAADLAARKLDEDLENGVIDRATYVAERKKLAQQ